MRPTQWLAWLLLAILGLFSVVVYGDLPTAMSLSLSGQGRPTRATSAWAWSIVPLTAFLTLAALSRHREHHHDAHLARSADRDLAKGVQCEE